MDISNLKDIVRKLGILKDYSSLVVPAVIALVGVFIFTLTLLMGSKFKDEITKRSIPLGITIKSLSKEDAVSSGQGQEEKKYQDDYEEDATRIALLAKRSSRRELLSYKIFPQTKDSSTLIFEEFGQQFRNSIDGLLTRVNALDCPTDAELDRSLRSSSGPRRSGRRRRTRLSGRLSEVDATIKDVLCQEKAESASVYTNPADLSGYEFWEEYEYPGVEEAVEDCWYWQLAYWIIEDVIDTIEVCNAWSSSVLTSPVKRILDVSFVKTTGEKRRMKKAKRKTSSDRPRYVLSLEEGFTESCTGRFSNDDVDVVHFNVAVIADTKAVLLFMKELCSARRHKFKGFLGEDQEQNFKHNRITILESDIGAIDREDEAHNLYRYGEDAVVRLDLICEYIFNKSGYDEIKPESVKKSLKQPEEKTRGRRQSRR